MRNAYNVLVGKPGGKNHLEDLSVEGEDNIRIDLREIGWRVWTSFIWLRIRTSGGLLRTR
jgi:hypothetical protein